jgi:hypothetical protein
MQGETRRGKDKSNSPELLSRWLCFHPRSLPTMDDPPPPPDKIANRFVSQDALDAAKAQRQEEWKKAYERLGQVRSIASSVKQPISPLLSTRAIAGTSTPAAGRRLRPPHPLRTPKGTEGAHSPLSPCHLAHPPRPRLNC